MLQKSVSILLSGTMPVNVKGIDYFRLLFSKRQNSLNKIEDEHRTLQSTLKGIFVKVLRRKLTKIKFQKGQWIKKNRDLLLIVQFKYHFKKLLTVSP